jgi:hypothetical protein
MHFCNYFLLILIKTLVPKSCNSVTDKSIQVLTYTQDVAAKLYIHFFFFGGGGDYANIKESDYIWCKYNIQYLQITLFNSTARIHIYVLDWYIIK